MTKIALLVAVLHLEVKTVIEIRVQEATAVRRKTRKVEAVHDLLKDLIVIVNTDQDLGPDLDRVLVDLIEDPGIPSRNQNPDPDRTRVDVAVPVVRCIVEKDAPAMGNIRNRIDVSEYSV